eukprot:CAMPEP_0179344282 /NCGR_PEP_ID=MMETSP0797-20121207/71428_1 /TAXON_ID=47934 /ORGANISM="Dinophysis acuminata, Strain DAEP01" /LENGTH=115 /DNA_ID=CAMNT_0021058695 /DNA_START=109 /DNA_END=453 /DNA_ORIENTATION=+
MVARDKCLRGASVAERARIAFGDASACLVPPCWGTASLRRRPVRYCDGAHRVQHAALPHEIIVHLPQLLDAAGVARAAGAAQLRGVWPARAGVAPEVKHPPRDLGIHLAQSIVEG